MHLKVISVYTRFLLYTKGESINYRTNLGMSQYLAWGPKTGIWWWIMSLQQKINLSLEYPKLTQLWKWASDDLNEYSTSIILMKLPHFVWIDGFHRRCETDRTRRTSFTMYGYKSTHRFKIPASHIVKWSKYIQIFTQFFPYFTLSGFRPFPLTGFWMQSNLNSERLISSY